MLKSILLILMTCFFLSGCSNQSNNNAVNTTYINEPTIDRTATNSNITNTSFPKIKGPKRENKKVTEQELSSFTTKIYTKDPERQTNLNLTCSSLNGTIVQNLDTFSFTKTIGPATSKKGYQEADIFDSNGNVKKGLGGGNCQVSSTLYNAVLNVPTLTVVERHEHSNKVPYVKEGKDAAVAYGSIDFKFKNNSGFPIKIYAEATNDNVTIRLVKLIK